MTDEKKQAAGRKGGLARGASKRRGDKEYYRRIQKLSAEKRRANKEAARVQN